MNELIDNDLIRRVIDFQNKEGKLSDFHTAFNKIKSILANWSKNKIFALRIALTDTYSQENGKGFLSGLCKNITVNFDKNIEIIIDFLKEIKVTSKKIILITNQQSISLENIKYMESRDFPTEKEIIIRGESIPTSVTKKQIPLTREGKKNLILQNSIPCKCKTL